MISYLKAKLTSFRKINVVIFTDIPRPERITFYLYKEGELVRKDVVTRFHSINNVNLFDIYLDEDYDLGANYSLVCESLVASNIDTSDAIYFPEFDDKYYYEGSDLGNNYSKKATEFVVWAPLSTSTFLRLVSPSNEERLLKMHRENSGVFRLKVEGDLLNYKYHYIVNNNGVISEANDPYAKASSLNSEYSAIVDMSKLVKNNVKLTSKINNYVDASIYEVHIRDINEGNFNNVKNKGKYVGFVETGRKSKGGHPAGLDYIKYLGVSHVQLQPILDFNSLDDKNTSSWYNWGYDPISFFALEGSYSLHPEDPFERIKEFRFLVDEMHKNGLRVNIDVVYNHIYKYETSDFEKLVPHYYFRNRKKNYLLANASGCGNDLASERKMARKIIVDSVRYLFETFDIDGLRFDLMGLMDIKTVKECYKAAKSVKEDIMFYGEGWNMGVELDENLRANKDNQKEMPDFAFFNDTYRDIVKGPSAPYNLHEKGYICGNTSYVFGLDYAFHGCVLPLSYKPMFSTANQSLNFIECHDNNTLYDKLLVSNKNEDERTLLDRVNLANSILLLSFGIPFIHMGQEIGLSKDGLDNTYNVTKVNNLDYRLVDERFDMVNRFRLMNILRKKLGYCHLFNPSDLDGFFTIAHWENGIYYLSAKNKNVVDHEKEFVILINPTSETVYYELEDYYTVLEGENKGEEINIKNGFLPGCNLITLFLKK